MNGGHGFGIYESGMKVTIIAHPNAKMERVEKDLLGELHVYVKQPPLEGKANRAIEEALADYFQVKKSEVFIESGMKGKRKVVSVLL